MMKLHFPHISRLFSAYKSFPFVPTLCWSVLVACIIINIRASSANSLTAQNVRIPQEVPQINDSILLRQDAPPVENDVLGSKSDTLGYWRNIIMEKPDYRDAYLAAAKAALSENKGTDALQFTKQALELDPNNEIAITLATVLQKSIRNQQ